jgi:hypothetical protein
VNEIDSEPAGNWESTLKRLLPLWGHRNWIVVADAAYPAQSNPGIQTIATGADHLGVLNTVLAAIDISKHVRAKIHLDQELTFVSEQDAPGVARYREALAGVIGGRASESLAHEQIISKLDECGRLFRTLILKSTLTIPYTSVFIELDCGYWSGEAEKRLRQTTAGFDAAE